ncbi:TadE family type IV pilus minor pilin [Acrocarpospora catenulata]|uniref:TadE family type IV pilus minor pilin n=1 Tax=Acrocarpospora catenulata TaxID=2836182 RepID=UPI0035589DB0
MGDAGSVTAEMAVALPTLVVVLGAALWAIAVVCAQLECVDAARAGARAAARGESVEAVREAAIRSAPDGARVTVAIGENLVRVTITADIGPRVGHIVSPITVVASASSISEPGLSL